MKTLHAYLTRQVLATTVLTVAVFTFVLLLGNVLKEIIELLVNRQATLFGVIQAIGLLIPYVLAYALPIGMLTATLLVFGRFSADQELTAARASGISLVALITPLLWLSLIFSALCAWVNLQIAPQCRIAYKHLLYQVIQANPTGLLRENQYNPLPDGWTVYARKIKGNQLQGVKIYQVNEGNNSLIWYNARAGKYSLTNGFIEVVLFDANASEVQSANVRSFGTSGELTLQMPTKSAKNKTPEIRLIDMTFSQLQMELKKLERSFIPPKTTATGSPPRLRDEIQRMKSMREEITMPVRVEIHRQIAFSFACIGFTLIGIPLGIRSHRRETSAGIAIALVLILVYYSFIILAQSLGSRPEFFPHLIVWIPNFVFQICGGILLWRANKGAS